MRKIYLSANRYTQEQEEKANKVSELLRERGCEVTQDPRECDLVVSLGGDGAMLKAAKIALAMDKPLAGINAGRLGYLCAIELADLDKNEDPFSGLKVSERAVLETEAGGQHCYALNDVVLGKRFYGQTVEMEVLLDGRTVMGIRGDGLIISTPTGSTAYNRNAGGPLMLPDVDALCLTPICSAEKPLVVSGRGKLEVRIKRGDCDVYIDGVKVESDQTSYFLRCAEKKLWLLH